MTAVRAVLCIAEFDDYRNAHVAQQCRALTRLGVRLATFALSARPSLLERIRGGDQNRRLERAIDEHMPDLVLVAGGAALSEELVDRLRGRARARWINWLPNDLRTVAEAAT